MNLTDTSIADCDKLRPDLGFLSFPVPHKKALVARKSPPSNLIRKTALLFIYAFFSNPLSLLVFGFINRIFGCPVRSIFLCYPAHAKYAEKYAFKWMLPHLLNNPGIIGVYFQGSKLGLILISSANEKFFKNNKTFLENTSRRLEKIRKVVGAQFSHMAGVLPSEMHKHCLIKSDYFEERCQLVAKVVMKAESILRKKEQITEAHPVLLLGGAGSIGSKLLEQFKAEGRDVYSIDRGDSIPEHIRNKKAILIDVSRRGILKSYVDKLWSDIVLLNETFPEPDSALLSRLKQKGIVSYHVSGVKAVSFPSFPYAYRGAVPCCAAIASKNMNPLIKRLE